MKRREFIDRRYGRQEQSRRLNDAMRHLGWRRANKARTIKVEDKDVMGFVYGEQPWRLILVTRDKYGELRVLYQHYAGHGQRWGYQQGRYTPYTLLLAC